MGWKPISTWGLESQPEPLPAGSVPCIAPSADAITRLLAAAPPAAYFYLHAWDSCFQLSSNK